MSYMLKKIINLIHKSLCSLCQVQRLKATQRKTIVPMCLTSLKLIFDFEFELELELEK